MGFKEDNAKKFKKAREDQSLTQAQVAKRAKISTNYYARIERADPEARGNVLDRIAKALGVKL